MRKVCSTLSIEQALLGLQEAINETVGNYPLLDKYMNIRVVTESKGQGLSVSLEDAALHDLCSRAKAMQTQPELLIKNLILEYLYDM